MADRRPAWGIDILNAGHNAIPASKQTKHRFVRLEIRAMEYRRILILTSAGACDIEYEYAEMAQMPISNLQYQEMEGSSV